MKNVENRAFLPFLNAILRFAQTRSFPGKYRLYQYFSNRHKGRVIKYVFSGSPFYVPIEEWCFWLENGPENYYPQDLAPLIQLMGRDKKQYLLLDCGADIGTVSMMLHKSVAGNISKTVCIEPNPNAFELLQSNTCFANKEVILLKKALSNYDGHCFLNLKDDLTSDHEAHLVLDKSGDTEVIALDSLASEVNLLGEENIVLKIDVEGQEKAVLEGASRLIQSAANCILLIELHPDVLEREGHTPEHIFDAAEKIGDFKWTVPEMNNQAVDRSVPFFEQFPTRQYDVMAYSQARLKE